MVSAKVIAPCYIDGEIAKVGSVVKVDESDFERLFIAKCLIEKKEAAGKKEKEEKEKEKKEKEKEKEGKK